MNSFWSRPKSKKSECCIKFSDMALKTTQAESDTAFCFAPLASNVCDCTFAAVSGVVRRCHVAKVVRGHLCRRSSDPVETITRGEVAPTAGAVLEITLGGWTFGPEKWAFISGNKRVFPPGSVWERSGQTFGIVMFTLYSKRLPFNFPLTKPNNVYSKLLNIEIRFDHDIDQRMRAWNLTVRRSKGPEGHFLWL